jgi:hypothetical protein
LLVERNKSAIVMIIYELLVPVDKPLANKNHQDVLACPHKLLVNLHHSRTHGEAVADMPKLFMLNIIIVTRCQIADYLIGVPHVRLQP